MPIRCSSLNLLGKTTWNLILRSPRTPFSLLARGMPWPLITFSNPGKMISLLNERLIFSPVRSLKEKDQPVSAFTNGIFSFSTKSLSILLKKGCCFSEIKNTRSAGSHLGLSSPIESKMILVAFFHPGFTSIVWHSGFWITKLTNREENTNEWIFKSLQMNREKKNHIQRMKVANYSLYCS